MWFIVWIFINRLQSERHTFLVSSCVWLHVCFNVVYTGVIGRSRESTFFMSQDGGLTWKAVRFLSSFYLLFLYTCVSFEVFCTVSTSPWKSLNIGQIFRAWKVLKKRQSPWNSLNLCQKVPESAWILFSNKVYYYVIIHAHNWFLHNSTVCTQSIDLCIILLITNRILLYIINHNQLQPMLMWNAPLLITDTTVYPFRSKNVAHA